MVPYWSANKVNHSETILKYFDPLRTHKYHTHIHATCRMMGEVSLETSPKSIMTQDMINSENGMNTTESTNRAYSSVYHVCLESRAKGQIMVIKFPCQPHSYKSLFSSLKFTRYAALRCTNQAHRGDYSMLPKLLN